MASRSCFRSSGHCKCTGPALWPVAWCEKPHDKEAHIAKGFRLVTESQIVFTNPAHDSENSQYGVTGAAALIVG
jgi:hypothetical protein